MATRLKGRRGRRPDDKVRREHFIRIRLHSSELAHLHDIAEAKEMSVSEMVRGKFRLKLVPLTLDEVTAKALEVDLD